MKIQDLTDSSQPRELNFKIQLERTDGIYVLHLVDTKTGNRTEVRGKSGYETDGYDPNDRLHQLLDNIGRSTNISDLINGNVVSINPNHPNSRNAKTITNKLFTEEVNLVEGVNNKCIVVDVQPS